MQTKLHIVLKPDFCFGLAAMLMLLPASWCFAWLCAAFVHELSHYVLLRLCGSKVYSVQLGLNGILMAAEPLTPGKEALCALAGPFGGLLLLLFVKWIPKTAVCACFQSLYNLLPVYPLDGGRAVKGILAMLFPSHIAMLIENAVEYLAFATIILLSIYAVFRLDLGIIPLLTVAFLVLRRMGIKIPCKPSRQRVQ